MNIISVVFPIGVFCFAVLYWMVPAKLKNALLLCTSIGIYFYADKKGALVLFSMILLSYFFGLVIEQKRKSILFLAVLLNFMPLLFFKIITFQRLASLNVWDLVMPLGLSYYSFKSVSYLCDIYRNKIKPERNIARYALFVSFFPEIFVGPIDRASNLLKQINEKTVFDWDKVKSGAILLAYGYFEKIVIADRLAIYVDTVYEDLFTVEVSSYQGLVTVMAVIFYSLQIYFDFAGCTNIVRGLGYMLGFELPENFKQPYLSTSVTEFWRKWHMSLTNWLRDYIYISLGGNRKGIVRKFINIMVVFIVCAIWHGVGVHFIIWGIMNAAFQIIEALVHMVAKLIKDDTPHVVRNVAQEGNITNIGDEKTLEEPKKSGFAFNLIKGVYTFIAISFTWIFFRAGNVGQALTIIKSMFAKWNPWVIFDRSIYTIVYSEKNWHLLLFSLLFAFIIDVLERCGISLREKMERQNFILQLLVIYSLIFGTILFGAYGVGYNAANFIYQAF